jgi:hypothetical protein
MVCPLVPLKTNVEPEPPVVMLPPAPRRPPSCTLPVLPAANLTWAFVDVPLKVRSVATERMPPREVKLIRATLRLGALMLTAPVLRVRLPASSSTRFTPSVEPLTCSAVPAPEMFRVPPVEMRSVLLPLAFCSVTFEANAAEVTVTVSLPTMVTLSDVVGIPFGLQVAALFQSPPPVLLLVYGPVANAAVGTNRNATAIAPRSHFASIMHSPQIGERGPRAIVTVNN